MTTIPGKRIIVAELDRRAREEPDRVLAMYPETNALDKWRKVTFLDYAKAVDRVCAFLEPILGKGTNFETQAYYGPPDMRYHFFMFACIKLGHKALFSAPRNSQVMQQHVLKAGEAKTIFHDPKLDMPALLGDTNGMPLHPFPTLHDLLWAEDEPRHYVYSKTFDEAKMDPYLVLHTSGSTGMPKPIIHRQGWASIVDKGYHHPGAEGRASTTSLIAKGPNCRLYAPFPPFHVSGAELIMIPQITREVVWIWGPTDRLPSVEDVKTCCKTGKATVIGMPTQLYKDFLNDKEGYEILKNMKTIGYGGGPMDQEVGAKLSAFGPVHDMYGTTEAGWIGVGLETDPDAWDHLYLKPNDPGIEFRETTPGIYELVIVRTPETEDDQAIWYSFPELREWNTKDLWHKHPTKPNHWFYEGRADDLIVYSGGSKFNPLAMEEQIREDPLVLFAIVVGNGRNQSALLVELTDEAKKLPADEAIERIWPAIAAANAVAPKHAVIARSHILFEVDGKPFDRTSKGTVQRLPTLRKYESEFDALFAREGDHKMGGTIAKTLSRASANRSDGAVKAPGAPVDGILDSSDDGDAVDRNGPSKQNGHHVNGAVSGAKRLVNRAMNKVGLH